MRKTTLLLALIGVFGLLECRNQTAEQPEAAPKEEASSDSTNTETYDYDERERNYMEITTIFSPEEMKEMRRRLIKEYRNADYYELDDWMTITSAANDPNPYPDSLTITEDELAADMDDFYRIMRKKCLVYKPVSDSLFAEKMKQVFGLDIKDGEFSGRRHLSTYPVESSHFSIEGRKACGFYFDLKNHYILFGAMSLLMDHVKFVTEFEFEHDRQEGEEELEVLKSYAKSREEYFSKAKEEEYAMVFDSMEIETAYHMNNFVFNDGKSSFLWLSQQRGLFFFESLFEKYNYDKDPRINKIMFDHINVDKGYPLNYDYEVNNVFSSYERSERKLHIRTGMMQYVVDNCYDEKDKDEYGILNDKKICVMEDYLDYLFSHAYSGIDGGEEYRNAQYKTAAYVSYYLQKAYENYRTKSGGKEPRCWHSALANGLRDDRKEHGGSFESYVKKNGYFGLEGLDKMMVNARDAADD